MFGRNSSHSEARQKWGQGSDILTSAHQRRSGRISAEFSRVNNNDDDDDDDDDWDGDFGPPNCNDGNSSRDADIQDDNLFDSIGRALDQREEDAKRAEESEKMSAKKKKKASQSQLDTNYNQSNNDGEPFMGAHLEYDGKSDREWLSEGYDNGEHHHDSHRECRGYRQTTSSEFRLDEPRIDQTPAPRKFANGVPRISKSASNSTKSPRSRNGETNGHQLAHVSIRRGGTTSSVAKKMSPTRFSFQSSAKSSKKTALKTPSRNNSLPSRALFSSSAMSQRPIKNKPSSQKRQHRHTFRQSMGHGNISSNDTPTINNNVRDLGFVPTFLANPKGGYGSFPKDAPTEDDDDFDSRRRDTITDAFSQNIVSEHAERQRLSTRKAESSNAKSGYLVRRLRSLRNTDQCMAMRLRRSGQHSTPGAISGGSAFMSRKRRRSGSDSLDPTKAASSTLDVTVSGTPVSDDGSGHAVLGDDRTVLLAYIHRHTLTKQQPPFSSRIHNGNGLSFPCFAWIIMSRDAVRERGISDGGITQIRFYDAVVIPPRVADTKSEQCVVASEESKRVESHMPTIICTQIFQEYPAEQPPLQEVSFDRFN
mmetsp:Transcript_41796/g.87729  ORF Transcript_41796/g.87729 Transcript_41796/m.87729 type:complete len:592 (+) Transcript_41796:26-1801(+)